MKRYKDIPICENLRRKEKLIKFRNLVVEYFDNIEYLGFSGREIKENIRASQLRSEINLILYEIHSIIKSAGVSLDMFYSPPPAIGGIAGNIDLVANLFNLNKFRLGPRYSIDVIEKAIGVYQNDKINALIRTINPFYWLIRLLDCIASLPFIILGQVGFNKDRLESSFVGRLFKGFLYLITVFAAFLTILEKLNYLEWFKKLVFKK